MLLIARALKPISIIYLIEDNIMKKEICYNAYMTLMSRPFSSMKQRIKRMSLFVLLMQKTKRVILESITEFSSRKMESNTI